MSNPVLVGWCPGCETVIDPYPGPGTVCEGDDDGIDTWYYHHRLHKRRMWKCEHDDCFEWGGPSYFLSRKDAAGHNAAYVEIEE